MSLNESRVWTRSMWTISITTTLASLSCTNWISISASAAPQSRISGSERWVDWADGSTFLQQAQAKNDLVTPYLQVKDKAGNG